MAGSTSHNPGTLMKYFWQVVFYASVFGLIASVCILSLIPPHSPLRATFYIFSFIFTSALIISQFFLHRPLRKDEVAPDSGDSHIPEIND